MLAGRISPQLFNMIAWRRPQVEITGRVIDQLQLSERPGRTVSQAPGHRWLHAHCGPFQFLLGRLQRDLSGPYAQFQLSIQSPRKQTLRTLGSAGPNAACSRPLEQIVLPPPGSGMMILLATKSERSRLAVRLGHLVIASYFFVVIPPSKPFRPSANTRETILACRSFHWSP